MAVRNYLCTCSYCGNDFMGTHQQITYTRQGKNVFCPGGDCIKAYKANRYSNGKYVSRAGQWDWLNVPHVLDCLPTQDDPDVYVGY